MRLELDATVSPALPLMDAGLVPTLQRPQTPVHWPSLKGLLRHMRTKPTNIGRFTLITAAFLRSYSHRQRFEAQVSASLVFSALQRRGAEAYTPLFRALLDKRFSMAERFDVYLHSVERAESLLSPGAALTLHSGERITLVSVDGFSVDFGCNEYSMEEGLWGMTLRSPAGHRLSTVSFSFLQGNRMLIGSVQGPKMSDEAALADIRTATHTLHGLRPPHFLMAVLKCFAAQGGQQLLGIDPGVKARLRRWPWSKPYHFDYRAFWTEQGGEPVDGHYWRLSLANEVRPLEEVPSKKRAMYRRRGELLQSLPLRMQPHLAALRED